jgi:hypothetical protein
VADTLALPWLARPREAGPLAAWGPVDLVAGGLPVLLRGQFDHPREDLVLRAFLGQPLILYGHHDLLAHGPDTLAEAAAQIERLGQVRWCSLAAIARANAAIGLANTARQGASGNLAEPVLDARAQTQIAMPPRRARALARRLASESRDRAQATLRRTRDPAVARGGKPTSSSARM